MRIGIFIWDVCKEKEKKEKERERE